MLPESSKKDKQPPLPPQIWDGSVLENYRKGLPVEASCNSICYSLLHRRSPEIAPQVLDDWSRDSTYKGGTFHLYVRDKHPELWAEILPELIKHRLLR